MQSIILYEKVMFIVTGSRHIRPIWPAIAAIGIAATIMVATAQSALAIARGYETTDAGLQVGMVAALSTEGSSNVERATQTNTKRVVGVVTTFDTAAVSLASGKSKILVEGEGEVQVYVSDMNGVAKQGDELVMSQLKGILMKAGDDNTDTVLAIASQDVVYGPNDQLYPVEKGTTKDTKITKTKVNLNRQGSSVANGQKEDSSLAKLGKAIVGKDIGEVRVLVALLIFIIVLIAEGGIIYGAVTSAITALGRNPMARKIIRKEMVQVLAVAVGVLFIGLGAVYGILWL